MSKEEIKYSVLSLQDYPEVQKFFDKQFLPRNPLAIAAGMTRFDDYPSELEQVIRWSLESGLSIGARDTVHGILVGCRLSLLLRRDEKQENAPESKVFKALAKLSEGVNLFEDKSVQKVCKMFAVGVHSDYTGRGIGGTMVKKTLELGQEHGCHLASVEITNLFADKIFKKLGFEVVNTVDLTTLDLTGLDVSRIPGDTVMKLMVKRLQ